MTVTDGVSYYVPNGTLTYTIEVRNNGPQSVVGATFADAKPTQVTGWIWTCTPDSGATCLVGPLSIATTLNDTVTIPAGAKVRYSVVATVNPAASGDLVNTVTAADPAGVTDPNLANNTATDTDAHPIADLTVTITDMVVTYTPGGTTIYTIVVTNNGPSNVTNASFVATLPVGQITGWTWTCAAQVGAFCTSEGFLRTTDFTDTAVSIPAGRSVIYTAVANISLAAAGPMPVNVVINPPAVPPTNVPDPNMANNNATDIDTP